MPNTTYNKALKPYAQKLRREMTREEKHLWYQFLKPQGIKAKRQQIIRTFIVDFYIPSAGIVIEIDGSQHCEQEAQARDQERDAALDRLGLLVLRYSNSDINQRFRDVCEDILQHLSQRTVSYPLEVSEGRSPSDCNRIGRLCRSGGDVSALARKHFLSIRRKRSLQRAFAAKSKEGEVLLWICLSNWLCSQSFLAQ